MMWLILIVIGVVAVFIVVGEEQKKWALCPHEVRGGKTQNLCERCIKEQKEIEEKNRRERELRERRKQIDFAADGLQHRERARLDETLKKSIEELRSLSWQGFEDEIARCSSGWDTK